MYLEPKEGILMKTMELLKDMNLLMRSLHENGYLIAIITFGWIGCVISSAFSCGMIDSDSKIIRFLGHVITAIVVIVFGALVILLFLFYM